MSQSGKKFRSAAGVGLAFLAGIAVFAGTFAIVDHFRGSPLQPMIPIADRQPAGSLVLPALALDPAEKAPPDWSLEGLRGKVVVVNYFATWCPPCNEELPDLIKLAKEYQARGVEFAMVSMDRDGEQAPGTTRETVLRAFVKAHKVPMAMLLPQADSMLWREVFPVPQTFVYDKAGRKAQFILGKFDEGELRKTLETLLKEPS